MPNVVINCLNLSGGVDIPYESSASFDPSSIPKVEEINGGINQGTSSADYEVKVQPSSDSDGSLEWTNLKMWAICWFLQPRLLECLHSFCEKCIVTMLESKEDNDPSGALEDFQNESKTPPGVVKCPICSQATNIGNDLRWVKYLKPDFIKANRVTAAEFKQMILSCESCKAEEPAMARCLECSCFLCISCINAHNYMKCFDGHEVVSFENLKVGNDSFIVHRPVFCQGHCGEPLKYFCAACNEELLQNAANDVDARVQLLRDNVEAVRSEIEEHFECCLQAIRNARDNVLQQLERTETDTEGQIMERFRKMRNTMEKISDACIFTNQLLKYGSALELIISGKIVSSQLIQLAHSIPNADATPSIVFVKEPQLCEKPLTRLFVDTNELRTTEQSPSEQFGGLFKPSDWESTAQSQKPSKLTSFDVNQQTSPPRKRLSLAVCTQHFFFLRSRFGSNGSGCGQFDSPHGFCISNDDDLIIADSNNHRIQVLSIQGLYKYQFGVPGRADGYLWYPRKVALLRDNNVIVVCDRGSDRSRMQFFSRNGTFLKSIQIRFAEIVAGLAIDEDGSIVIVDSVKPTVYCVSHSGEVSRWFTCQNMLEPSDLAIYQRDYFICDFKGHAVYVFTSAGTIIRRIGSPSVTPFPSGIVITPEGRVLVGDSHGNHFHIAIFLPTGGYIGERECTSVSRCSGLQFTKEGYVVTLVKNNHCILILNPLN
ncbi:Brain tumor protein [Trichuris trichiura]|uniref:Brain tumor protein n=1 Tax=Trichuris trichiura TaxID=36087 RepID=A0A077Z4V7_TRITR|nr:Brain tumor protein [Trichuris trichiura]